VCVCVFVHVFGVSATLSERKLVHYITNRHPVLTSHNAIFSLYVNIKKLLSESYMNA